MGPKSPLKWGLMEQPPLLRAADPGSDRLTREQIIEIHKAHRRGVAWKQIAEDYGTSPKNVSRIVQGLRWRAIHPAVRPDLYAEGPVQLSSSAALEALSEIEQQVAELRSILGSSLPQ